MSAYTDAERFLQAVFGSDYGTRAIFAHLIRRTPPLKNYMQHFRTLADLDPKRDCYWSIAAFPLEAITNLGMDALGVRALSIDDVGTKGPSAGAVELALGRPTAIIESSAGNFQWVYRLTTPVAVTDWGDFLCGVETLIAHTVPLEARGAQTLMRLPMGRNTKPDNNGFEVRLVEVNAGIMLDPATIAYTPGAAKAPASGGAKERLKLEKLQALMDLVPNTFDDRDTWIEVGHGVKALCENDDDGFAVFDKWSLQHPSYDEAETHRAWDSFGAGGLRSQGGLLKARAEQLNPQGYAALVFDDGVNPPSSKRAGITATPYQWVDPDKLPLRDWLYGDILIRRFISMTVAPGGVGKSSLTAVETLAQVTGQNLLGEKLHAGPLRVWLWNLEDPHEETQRKIQAAAKHYGISEADIGNRLFVDSGRQQQLVVAVMERNAPTIRRPVVSALVEQIKLREIDVVVIDPFVSCHEVPENDNTAQDMVVKEWGRVAELGNCAVHLIDHTRKSITGAEVTTESSRGGKAKTDAARIVRVVNRMTEAEGASAGVPDMWRHFRTFNDKANMAPPLDRSTWFRLESVGLGNGGSAAAAFGVGSEVVPGDMVGVVRCWKWPSPQDMVTGPNFIKVVTEMGTDEWRVDYQAKEKWVGTAVAHALNLDVTAPKDRKYINGMLDAWFKSGVLKKVPQRDKHRKLKDYVKIAGGY